MSQVHLTTISPSRNRNRAYVVFRGRVPGIYNTVEEMQAQVDGYSGNLHQAYSTDQAIEEWKRFLRTGVAPGDPSYTANSSANSSTNMGGCDINGHDIDNHNIQTASSSQAPPRATGHDLIYFAVIHGRRPGVYPSRTAAQAAIGEGYTGKARRASTRDSANMLFVSAFMNQEVARFE
ncbi:hypothetical protein C0991_002827 [Blastosporella zonata]|nr:hypothetical protein C0991_002827 [Blastosporella zonata]